MRYYHYYENYKNSYTSSFTLVNNMPERTVCGQTYNVIAKKINGNFNKSNYKLVSLGVGMDNSKISIVLSLK